MILSVAFLHSCKVFKAQFLSYLVGMMTADLKLISAPWFIVPFHLLQYYLQSPKLISVPVCVGNILSRIKTKYSGHTVL